MNPTKSALRAIQVGLLAAGAALTCGNVLAQQSEADIVIQAARPTTVARGAPDEVVSIQHRVTYADLDLATQKGDRELEKRINDAAVAVCKRIDSIQTPQNQEDRACVKRVVDAAMVQAHAAISAASEAAAK